MHWVWQFLKSDGSNKSLLHNLTLAGKHQTSWKTPNITHLYAEDATISQPKLHLQRRHSVKHSTAIAWMERYFNRIGDKMPHLQQIHLPNFLSKKMVYELMVQDLTDEGMCKQEIISSSHFYAVWKDEFHSCIIPKVCIMIHLPCTFIAVNLTCCVGCWCHNDNIMPTY